MFDELLESRARTVRNRGGMIVSLVAHVVFIALAVTATRTTLIAKASPERIVDLPTLRPDPVAAPAAPLAPTANPRPSPRELPFPPRVPEQVSFPDDITPGMPPVDLTRPPARDIGWPTDHAPLTGGLTSESSRSSSGEIPFAAGVDKPAMALADNPAPRYPEVLRRASQRGEVVVQVVIDTTGRADMASVRIVSSDHPLLTDAVVTVLPRARFLPAETGGRKVRMWAVQRFVFEVK